MPRKSYLKPFNSFVDQNSQFYHYVRVPGRNKWEHGFRRGNNAHVIERNEKSSGSHFKSKVAWADSYGNSGIQFYDLNHGNNNNNEEQYFANHGFNYQSTDDDDDGKTYFSNDKINNLLEKSKIYENNFKKNYDLYKQSYDNNNLYNAKHPKKYNYRYPAKYEMPNNKEVDKEQYINEHQNAKYYSNDQYSGKLSKEKQRKDEYSSDDY